MRYILLFLPFLLISCIPETITVHETKYDTEFHYVKSINVNEYTFPIYIGKLRPEKIFIDTLFISDNNINILRFGSDIVNPFSGDIHIDFELFKPLYIEVNLYDDNKVYLTSFYQDSLDPGSYEIGLDKIKLLSGKYFLGWKINSNILYKEFLYGQ
jgi:hypothetical protein